MSAIVFISPKKRQKMFFMGITITFALILIFIALGVFLSQPPEVLPELVFNKPKIKVDTSIFDSESFKNLQPFIEMEMQYSYKALAKNNEVATGIISGASIDQVKATLEGMGYIVSEIKEIITGRDNPFAPYYQGAITQEQ